MNMLQCKHCIHFHQHYILSSHRCSTVHCGHCTKPRIKHRKPDAPACSHFQECRDKDLTDRSEVIDEKSLTVCGRSICGWSLWIPLPLIAGRVRLTPWARLSYRWRAYSVSWSYLWFVRVCGLGWPTPPPKEPKSGGRRQPRTMFPQFSSGTTQPIKAVIWISANYPECAIWVGQRFTNTFLFWKHKETGSHDWLPVLGLFKNKIEVVHIVSCFFSVII